MADAPTKRLTDIGPPHYQKFLPPIVQRIGMANFLDAIGLDPVAEMVSAPRDNPYVFFK